MLAIMQHGDGVHLDLALKTVARCGMISLETLEIIYRAKFVLLGIKAAMLELHAALKQSEQIQWRIVQPSNLGAATM